MIISAKQIKDKIMNNIAQCQTKPNSLKITSKIITVTPDLAKEWLETKNIANNRAIALKKAQFYAKAMLNNEWMIGDALKFDMEGMLCDGQHRLKAVTIANKAIDFLVLEGYEPKSVHVLDRGKPRDVSNIAQLQGFSWIKKPHVSVFNNIFFALPDGRDLASKMTDQERIKGICSIKDSFNIGLKYNRSPYIKNSALFAVICRAYYCPKVTNKESLHDFLLLVNDFNYHDNENLFFSTKLSPSAPLKLRQMFLTNSWELGLEGSGLSEHKYFYIQNALNNYLSNKVVKRMTLKTDNLFPVDFLDNMKFKSLDITTLV